MTFIYYISRIMRKPASCIYRLYQAAAQLISDFVFTATVRNFKPLAICCGRKARLVSDLVGNSEDKISRDAVYIILLLKL